MTDHIESERLVEWLRREASDTNCNAPRGEKLYAAADTIDRQAARIAALEGALRHLRGCVVEGGVPRYSVVPGAALNAIIEEEVDPLLRALEPINDK